MNKKPFKISLNQFAYLTHDEYMKRQVNLDSTDTTVFSPLSIMNTSLLLNSSKLTNMEQPSIQMDYKATLPVNFDWRQYNVILPPRHQLQCGSCWAFVTVII